jgi:PAS domain S-box-containing protein
MMSLGIFSWIAGALQLSVPSYALRLIRRFGAARVGWFVVAAFLSLAMLHLLCPIRPFGAAAASGLLLDLVYAVGSTLLVIGMGHIETLCSEREQTQSHEQRLQSEWETRVRKETSDLVRTNEQLLQEIARRDASEKTLQESEAQYRFLFTENPQPMWILDLRTSRFLAVNKAALNQYGFDAEEFLTMPARELLSGEAVDAFLLDVSRPCAGVQSRGTWPHRRKDGSVIDVEITAVDMKYTGWPARLVLASNVTQRRQREDEARQAHKMEIITQVSGGVADHFSTILSSIESNTVSLAQKSQDPAAVDQLKRISAAVTRGSALARQLLAVGGRYSLQLEALDLNSLIRNQTHTLRRLVGERIELQTIYGVRLFPVMADRNLIDHIVLNLVLNARNAMPEGGTITINTSGARVSDSRVESGQPIKAGEFLRLTVSDTGCGIAPEVQARLFEPFFSTGKGAGLGLASVYGAVRQLSGWIEFKTEVGVGTEFKIYLPFAPASDTYLDGAPHAEASRIRKTILLVEPDDRVRNLAHCVLNWHGYRVIEADSSSTALIFWENQASNIDLLLTDFDLSGEGSGCELASQLQQGKPGLKVIYAVNGAPEEAAESQARLEGLQFIAKPYSPEKLLKEVNGFFADAAADEATPDAW